MMHRALWLAFALGACTSPNPEFDDRADASAGSDASTATKPTTDDTVEPTDVETSNTMDPPPITDTASTTVGDTSSDGGSETGSACALPDAVDLVIVPANANPDAACASLWSSPQGVLSIDGNAIGVASCECPCPYQPVPEHTVSVAGVEIPSLPDCGYVVAWPKPLDDGCAWAGVAVFSGNQPGWLAASSMFVPQGVFGGLEISRAEDTACPSESCATAGTHALQFTGVPGDDVITMEEEPKVMMLPFGGVLPYLVDNVSAVRDEACIEHLAWTAKLAG